MYDLDEYQIVFTSCVDDELLFLFLIAFMKIILHTFIYETANLQFGRFEIIQTLLKRDSLYFLTNILFLGVMSR